MSMTEKEINDLANALADKLSVDVLPAGLVKTLQGPQSLRPYAGMVNAYDYVELRLSKMPDDSALLLEWWFNGTVVSRQRFGVAGAHDSETGACKCQRKDDVTREGLCGYCRHGQHVTRTYCGALA